MREISAESVAQGHVHHHDHDHGHDCVWDEHIWLSPKNAIACVRAIAQNLSECREAAASDFAKNAESYVSALTDLDARYTETVAQASAPRLLFADRFPFIYLTEDYGIEYLAAFEGCSTESGATAQTMARLAQRINDWQLSYVCITETANRALAESVIRNTQSKQQTIVTLHAMQSVTAKQIESGFSYLTAMEQNLSVLRQILL